MLKETNTIVIIDETFPATEIPGLKLTIKGLTPYPMRGTTKEDILIED
jgi:hypothetical protein